MVVRDRLDPDKISENLGTSRVGKKILVYDRTSSTNDVAERYAKSGGNDGLVVFAEEQTSGRGRTGAKWHSSYGRSILCSIVLNSRILSSEMMPLMIAVATAEAIGKVGRSSAKIKWPNDVILNGKKVAGILVESKRSGRTNSYIVGIGINCHQQKESFPPELQTIATSIDIESKTVCDRMSLARRLLISIDQWLEVAHTNSGEVTSRWRELNMQLGHRIAVLCSGKRFVGNCIGIDPEKGLVLQLDSGLVRMFPAAHTTIDKGK